MEQQADGAAAPSGDAPTTAAPFMNQDGVPEVTGAVPNLVNNQFDPEGMASILAQGQVAMADPSMINMPIADPSFMMPFMMANGNGMPAEPKQVSADDIALYDRQIRLWGMKAQAKIQNANILLISMRALGNEIAKNLVLAGIGSLTVLEDATVTETDLGAQFLLSEEDIGKNRAEAASVSLQKLNPRVNVHVDAEGVKSKGPSYFAGFDIVIATDLDPGTCNLINTATRINGRKFYSAGTHGMYGYIFSDLIEHDYVIERDVGNVSTQPKQETRTRSIVEVKTTKEGGKTTESVTKRELYSTWYLAADGANLTEEYTKSKRRLRAVTPALSCLRALWEFMQLCDGRLPGNRDDLKMFTQIATRKHKALGLPSETLRPEFLRSFLQNLGSEIAPVTAILGGQLAQDVINVLGQTQQPIQNMVIFDGTTMESLMYALHPEGNLGADLFNLGATQEMDATNGVGMVPGMLPADMSALGVLPGGSAMDLDPTAMAGLTQQQSGEQNLIQTGMPTATDVTMRGAIQVPDATQPAAGQNGMAGTGLAVSTESMAPQSEQGAEQPEQASEQPQPQDVEKKVDAAPAA